LSSLVLSLWTQLVSRTQCVELMLNILACGLWR